MHSNQPIAVLVTIVMLVTMSAASFAQSVVIDVKVVQNSSLQMEPITLSVTISNASARDWVLPSPLVDNLRFDIHYPSGRRAETGFGPARGRRLKPQFASLPRQGVLRIDLNLIDGLDLAEIGRYRIGVKLDTRAEGRLDPDAFYGSTPLRFIHFEIRQPIHVPDSQAFAEIEKYIEKNRVSIPFFWPSRHPSLFLKLLEDFPSSRYARYARFYYAEHLRTFYGEELRRIDQVDKAIEQYRALIRDYSRSDLTEKAYWGIARCLFLKREFESATTAAQEVIARYPGTYVAQEAAKLQQEVANAARKPADIPHL